MRAAAVLLACAAAACSAKPQAAPEARPFVQPDAGFVHVPPFARLGYAPFSRADAVAVALREWRAWGAPVDDDPPGSRPPRGPDEKPERFPGLWQRVGEYWWTGQDAGSRMAGWTGKHDEAGQEFPAAADGQYAWSAAFVSYVMRVAGAGERFPYSGTHADYIDAAREASLGQASGVALSAERPEAYAPQPGDLVCLGRGHSQAMRFDDLPAAPFPGHCDIVVAAEPGMLTVIGGNVDDAVTEKHVPVTQDGLLAAPGGTVVDGRYPWFVALRVLYDR